MRGVRKANDKFPSTNVKGNPKETKDQRGWGDGGRNGRRRIGKDYLNMLTADRGVEETDIRVAIVAIIAKASDASQEVDYRCAGVAHLHFQESGESRSG